MDEERKPKSRDKDKNRVVSLAVGSTIAIFLIFTACIAARSFWNLEMSDASVMFLSIIPFVVYLVIAGRITELRGGGFEVKFNKESGKEVLFDRGGPDYNASDAILKGNLDALKDVVRCFREDPSATLAIVLGLPYIQEVFVEYLEELTKLESFKYVVFLDRRRRFVGFVSGSSLLGTLRKEEGRQVIDGIRSGYIDNIPGLRRKFISDAVSNREALGRLEKENLREIAVVDTEGKFLGFTDRETIAIGVLRSLLTGAS